MKALKSSKAEERALDTYPIKMTPLVYQDLIDQFGGKTEIDVNTYPRCLFQEGYKQAEEDLGWHSVKESLPPVGEEVIALCNESHGTTLPIACYMCFAHLVEDKTIFVEYDGWNIPGVKYWMPCPELPEK